MHKCEVCGTEFDSAFCPNCGAPAPTEEPTERKCPICGATVPAKVKFCPECGSPVTNGSSVTSSVSAAASMFSSSPIKPISFGSEDGGTSGSSYEPTSFEPTSFEPTKFEPTSFEPTSFAPPSSAPSSPSKREHAEPVEEEKSSLSEEESVDLAIKSRHWLSRRYALSTLILAIIPGYGILISLIGLLASFFPRFAEWNPGKLGKERKIMMGYTVAAGIFCVAALVGGILIHVMALPKLVSSPSYDTLKLVLPIMVWFILAAEVAALVLGVQSLPLGKELVMKYYGRLDPVFEVDTPRATAQDLVRALALAKRNGTVKKSLDMNHLSALVLVVLYILGAGIFALVQFFGNPYRTEIATLENAKKIELGADRGTVRKLLGNPVLDPGEREEDDTRWDYYGMNYLKLSDRISKIAEKEWKLVNDDDITEDDLKKINSYEKDIAEIRSQMSSLRYAHLVVEFDEDGKVEAVSLDMSERTDRSGSVDKYYDPSRITVSKTTCYSMEEFETIKVSVTYQDDSFSCCYMPVSLYTVNGNFCTVSWQPAFSQNMVRTQITVVGDWLPLPPTD